MPTDLQQDLNIQLFLFIYILIYFLCPFFLNNFCCATRVKERLPKICQLKFCGCFTQPLKNLVFICSVAAQRHIPDVQSYVLHLLLQNCVIYGQQRPFFFLFSSSFKSFLLTQFIYLFNFFLLRDFHFILGDNLSFYFLLLISFINSSPILFFCGELVPH